MLVIVVLGSAAALWFLAPVAIYQLAGNVEYTKHAKISADVQTLATALNSYKTRNGTYPSTAEGLTALELPQLPLDPWMNPYVYRYPGLKNLSGYDLFSAGPDRAADTADDDWGQ